MVLLVFCATRSFRTSDLFLVWLVFLKTRTGDFPERPFPAMVVRSDVVCDGCARYVFRKDLAVDDGVSKGEFVNLCYECVFGDGVAVSQDMTPEKKKRKVETELSGATASSGSSAKPNTEKL